MRVRRVRRRHPAQRQTAAGNRAKRSTTLASTRMDVPKLMAYCGLSCDGCAIYMATRETDPEEQRKTRAKIAQFASQHYDTEIKPEDITDCDGCRAESGRLYSGCARCEIRTCAQAKGCPTCAHCPEYPCDNLQTFFAKEPSAKGRLDAIWQSENSARRPGDRNK